MVSLTHHGSLRVKTVSKISLIIKSNILIGLTGTQLVISLQSDTLYEQHL